MRAASETERLRARHTLYGFAAAVWLTCALVQTLQSYILAQAAGRPWTVGGALITGMPWWISWMGLTPAIAWLASRYHFAGGRRWRSLGMHVIAAIAVSCVHLSATGSAYWLTTGRHLDATRSLANQLQRFFGNFFLESVLTYAAVVGVFVAIDFARAMRDEVVSRARLEAKTAGLEASLAKARLDALRMELNPHFLFNTLTAIAGLVGQDRKVEARQVIGRLAELLRRALDGREGHFATVTAEVEALENYLFIQRLRLEDRLRIHLAVDPCARDCLVPAMLLQQLVENAIRHGIEPLEGQGAVTIRIDRVDGSIRLVVRDTGVGLPCRDDGLPVREGIGLSNTRARLVHLYGERAVLQLSNCTGDAGGAEAIVVLPATQLPQKAMKSTPRPAAARPGA